MTRSPRLISVHAAVLLSTSLAACLSVETGDSGGAEAGNAVAIADRDFDPAAMSGALFECADADQVVYNLALLPSGATRFSASDSPIDFTSGTYSIEGEDITLDFPEVGFRETSVDHRVALGVLGIFVTPSLYCHAVALNADEAAPLVLECPLSNHIPDVSYEEDELHLRANGNVFWRHWDHLVAASDEVYGAQNGLWVQQGSDVAMFFGSPFFEPTLLTGTLDSSGLRIDQFDTSGGVCE